MFGSKSKNLLTSNSWPEASNLADVDHRRRPDGKAYSRGSWSAPHGLGSSGPRSAAGRSGICLSSLRREEPEEGSARADRVSVYGRLPAGFAGRGRAVPLLQAVVARGAGGAAARSGRDEAV